jgi:7,8-dihydroneopterin aldolase/epimerase/oxygenase
MSPKPIAGPQPGALAGLRRVFVRDLVLMTTIGVHDYEKRAPQRIIVSVDMTVHEQGPAVSDRIEDVVDYAVTVRRIEDICRAGHVNLVETLAERVAQSCLVEPRVLSVCVRIEKPDAISNAGSVGIEIERRRRPG